MKTLYVLAPGPTRVVAAGGIQGEIDSARNHAIGVVRSNPGWRNSISFPIEGSQNRHGLNGVNVKVDAFNDGGRVFSSLDIGYRLYDAWESVLNRHNSRDPLELPKVWFSKDFIDETFKPRSPELPPLPIKPEHRGVLLDQFTSYVEEWLSEHKLHESIEKLAPTLHDRYIRDIAYDKGVLSLIASVQEGELPETVLQEVWAGSNEIYNEYCLEVSARSSSRERE